MAVLVLIRCALALVRLNGVADEAGLEPSLYAVRGSSGKRYRCEEYVDHARFHVFRTRSDVKYLGMRVVNLRMFKSLTSRLAARSPIERTTGLLEEEKKIGAFEPSSPYN